MQLVPVLEIRHGKCVHTEARNAYSDQVVREDVLQVVARWYEKGVKRIHIVDVDAVESGEPENVDLIGDIKQKFSDLEIQVLGGIKCIESAYVWVDAGADYLVLNGKAMRQKNLLDDACVEFPGKILVELDSLQGNVGMGSGEPTFKLSSLAKQLEEDGVVGLVVTEISAKRKIRARIDSLLDGDTEIPNDQNAEDTPQSSRLICINELVQSVDIPVFSNGGIDKMGDLKSLLETHATKLSGVLIGKALYNGFCLDEANQLIAQYRA